MFPRVTAILVVQHAGDRLQATLDALQAQERRPDAVIAVLADAGQAALDQVAAIEPTHVVQLANRVPFGEAVRAADAVLEAPTGEADSLWLLAEDTAPEPDALDVLVALLELNRSVAVVAPKLVEWEHPDRIAHLGRSITRYGRTVDLVADELDQGQHDDSTDVLGVDAPGTLVRHEVWRALGGFDPGLPVADDALDLSVRARLAGHRVAVAPAARVRFAGDGVAGEPVGGARVVRRRHALERRAQLHRRLVYAPAATLPLHWLTLLPLAIVRSIGMLLIKAPGRITGELGAALRVMFSFGSIANARRTLKRARTTGWSSIAPLRVAPDEVRRRRRLDAEARRARARGRTDGARFLATGGGWVLLATAVVGIVLNARLLGASGLAGGALLPLSSEVGDLWRNAGYGWRDVGVGFVGAADPFAGVLAVLGSLAFWAPSWALVALWIVAVPAAALGAWFTVSRLTERGSLRALGAIAWAIAPPLMVALADGRPAAVLAHVLLGWLAYAALGAARSWAAAATAGLLAAGVVAAAPSLTPALLVSWIVGLAASGRRAVRLLVVPLPALALSLPLAWEQVVRGTPLGLAADPGASVPSEVPGPWWLVLGFPGGDGGGWPATIDAVAGLGEQVDARWVATALLAPLVLLAVLSFAGRRVLPALAALGTALLGLAVAVAAAHVSVATVGAEAVAVWTGAGQSLMWLGLIAGAVLCLDGVRHGAPWLAAVAGVAALVAVLPTTIALTTGQTAVQPAGDRAMPAFVVAEADKDPRVATITIEPVRGGGVHAALTHGAGDTLDAASTLAATRTTLTDDEAALAEIAGNLASRSGADADAAVEEFGARFVLLEPPSGDAEGDRRAEAAEARAQAALDGNAALVAVGDTAFGRLYRFADAPSPAPAAAIPAGAGAPVGGWITAAQWVVLGFVLLLSIPTGVGREAERRRRPARSPKRAPRQKRASAGEAATGEGDATEEAVSAEASDQPVEPEASEPEPDRPAEGGDEDAR